MALWKRREILRSWAQGAVYLGPVGSALLLPSRAQAADLNRQERRDWIYGDRVQLGAGGEGSVRIGLATGLREISVRSVTPISLGLSPHQGSRIRGSKEWTFRVHKGRAALRRYSLELASADPVQRPSLLALAKRWKERGYPAQIEERGSLLGLRGQVLDSRKLHLMHGQWEKKSDAQAAARHIHRQHRLQVRVVTQLLQDPEGWLVARDSQSKTEVRAEVALWILPSKEPLELMVRDEKGVQWLSRGRHFRGALYLALDQAGKLCVVNEVSESDALMGVVPAEIPANAAAAALRAQAIAARGQLFSKIGHRHEADPYSLCASVHCQAYNGFAVEHPRSSAAVRATKGQLLMRPDRRRLVDTVYSANSGGFSEHNEFVWPGSPDPQLRGCPDARLPQSFSKGISAANLERWLSKRPSAHCRPPKSSHNDVYRWERRLDLRKIVAAKAWPLPRGPIESFEVKSRGVSGRATQVELQIHGQRHSITGELAIRRAFGDLRSSMFLARLDGQTLHLRGGGFGHGVGMCQYGAMGMARAKASHAEILRHYYRNSTLATLW